MAMRMNRSQDQTEWTYHRIRARIQLNRVD